MKIVSSRALFNEQTNIFIKIKIYVNLQNADISSKNVSENDSGDNDAEAHTGANHQEVNINICQTGCRSS